MSQDSCLMLYCHTDCFEEFRALAQKAKEIGASHVFISDLPKSRWQWEGDRSDPYSNWGMMLSSIFKVVVPEKLKEWLPVDYAQKNLEIVIKRCEILKEYGLKPAFHGIEPFWLPEEVFRAHPDWRGPRIDHPRRAKKTYFSPCIDHPEVLDMYRRAIAELCRQAPIDFFTFHTNDAGGGICWSSGLYAGQNGPQACMGRSMTDRVTGFLSTLQAGAADAGVEATVDINANIDLKMNEGQMDSVWPFLKPKQFVNNRDRNGNTPKAFAGPWDEYYNCFVYPVIGIPQVFDLAEQLERAFQGDYTHRIISIQSVHRKESFDLVQEYIKSPVRGILDRTQLLGKIAELQAGKENAGQLLDIWEKINKATADIRHFRIPLLLMGGVNQRWITRPLVAFPSELTPEEKGYYRTYQFQANSEAEAEDYMNIQGLDIIRGFSGTFLATQTLSLAAEKLESAQKLAGELTAKMYGDNVGNEMALLSQRLKVLICMIRNIIHTARFQQILDSAATEQKQPETNRWPVSGDYKLGDMQNLIRSEVDNTYELIQLIKGHEQDLIKIAPDRNQEDIFVLGPDLVDQLYKKADIMLMHLLDSNRLFQRANI